MSDIDPKLLAAIKAAMQESAAAPPPEWLTTNEAAAHLKMPPGELAKWRANNHGPPFYQPSPRRYRYKRADLDAYLQSFEQVKK